MTSHFPFSSTDPSVITDERAQEIIDQGLETSRLNQRHVVAVITGLMGSGKTTLLSRLFNMLDHGGYSLKKIFASFLPLFFLLG